MGNINWRTRELKGGKRVLLTGTVQLTCDHTVQESAQVPNSAAGIAQGKRTVERMVNDAARRHMADCEN